MPPIEDDVHMLIRRCRNNDRRAQERLYGLYYAAMVSLCLRYTKNREDAVEVLNNGFLKVFKHIALYNPEKASLSTWIRTIVVRAAIDFLRSQKPVHTSLASFEEEESPVENEVIRKMDAEELLAMVRALPNTTRLVFNLHVMEGFSHKEIASMLDFGEGTSRWHLSEARKILKQTISSPQMKT